MAWQTGTRQFGKLEELSAITSRLLRLMLHEKLVFGETQLRSMGVNADFSPIYAQHAKAQSRKLVCKPPEKKRVVVNVSKESTF